MARHEFSHAKPRSLQRKVIQRNSRDHILIVTEGEKTEPNYFNEIRISYRISTANVLVCNSKLGTAPIQVVEYANKLYTKGDPHRDIEPYFF